MNTFCNNLKYFIPLIILISGGIVRGQDALFSQFYANSLYYNPAFAGSSGLNRISINYRDHWPELSSDFISYRASYDQPVELLHGGFGIQAFSDEMGDAAFRRFSAAFIYTYHLRVSRDMFIFAGFQTSVNQNRLDTRNLVFGDMIDPFRGIVYSTGESLSDYKKTYLDFAVGFLSIYKELHGGFVIHHLAKPGITDNPVEESRLPRKYSFHLGNNFYLKGSADRSGAIVLTPNFMYQYQQHSHNLNYGFSLLREPVTLGAWIRQDLKLSFNSVIFGLALNYLNVSISYTYDMAVQRTGLNIPGTGAHEISCIVCFQDVNKRNLIRTIKTPKI